MEDNGKYFRHQSNGTSNIFFLDSIISLDDDDSTIANAPQKTPTAHLVPGVEMVTAKFPSSFYAVDVHQAFTFKHTSGLTLEMQFEWLFQLPLKTSTYYDHKARWFSALHDTRDKAVAVGYIEGSIQ